MGGTSEENKAYKTYKVKAVVSIGLRTAAVTFAAVGLLSNPITALGGFLAIQTLIAGSVSVLDDLVTLNKAAAPLRKEIEELVVKLANKFTAGAVKANLTDFAAVNFKTVFGLELATVAAADGLLKKYNQKLTGVDQASHKSAKDLQKVLKQMDKTRAEAKDFIASQSAGEFRDLENAIQLIINRTSDMQAGITSGEKWSKATRGTIDELSSKKTYPLKVIEKSLNLSLAVAKVGIDYTDMTKLSESCVKQAGHATKWANGLYAQYKVWEKERGDLAKLFPKK